MKDRSYNLCWNRRVENEKEITLEKIFSGNFSWLMKDIKAQILEPQRQQENLRSNQREKTDCLQRKALGMGKNDRIGTSTYICNISVL